MCDCGILCFVWDCPSGVCWSQIAFYISDAREPSDIYMYFRIPPKVKLTALKFYIFLASQQLWYKVNLTLANWNGEILQQDINIKEDTHNQTKLHPRKRNNYICPDCVAMRSAYCWQQYLWVEWRGSAGSWSRRCGSDTLGASKMLSRTSRSIAAFRFCFYFVVDPIFLCVIRLFREGMWNSFTRFSCFKITYWNKLLLQCSLNIPMAHWKIFKLKTNALWLPKRTYLKSLPGLSFIIHFAGLDFVRLYQSQVISKLDSDLTDWCVQRIAS